MNDFLLSWDFSDCFTSSDVEFIWSLIKTAISTAINKFVPLARCRSCHMNLPNWFDESIHHNINQLSTLQRRYATTPTFNLQRRLTVLETDLQAKISEAKTLYMLDKLVSQCTIANKYKIYSHIRNISNRTTPQYVLQECIS